LANYFESVFADTFFVIKFSPITFNLKAQMKIHSLHMHVTIHLEQNTSKCERTPQYHSELSFWKTSVFSAFNHFGIVHTQQG